MRWRGDDQEPYERDLGFPDLYSLTTTPANYPLKGTARVWFYVDGATVYLELVHTAHPHETK